MDHAFSPRGGEAETGKSLWVEASLVYRVSSRTKINPVSEKKILQGNWTCVHMHLVHHSGRRPVGLCDQEHPGLYSKSQDSLGSIEIPRLKLLV